MPLLTREQLASFGKPVEPGDLSLKDKTFEFLVQLMGYRAQLRLNHWQTTSYAEHKMTDKLLEVLEENIDTIGEIALGLFERPQINSMSISVQDMRIASTKYILDEINKSLCSLVEEYKVTSHEGMITALGDLCAEMNKFKYLSTLE